jgi:structural maintenance of chromosome 1
MPVTYLELENFKSYAGKQIIGPFHQFTSIMGPNGAGKSNLMDAISFVLGVQSRDLRSSQMKDLIFRPPSSNNKDNDSDDDEDDGADDDDEMDGSNNKKKKKKKKRKSSHTNNSKLTASATLVYEAPSKEKKKQTKKKHKDNSSSDEDDDNNDDSDDVSDDEIVGETETIRFSRIISSNGTGEYRINNVACTFAKYEERLGSIGVLLKARNFLVFQGDVEALARKSPAQLTTLVEEVSGSKALADDYNAAQQRRHDLEQLSLHALQKQRSLKQERKTLRDQKAEAERFQKLQMAKAALQTDSYLFTLYHLQLDSQDSLQAQQEIQQELHVHETTTLHDAQEALKTAKKQASAARRHLQTVEQERLATTTLVFDKLEPQLQQTQELCKKATRQLAQDEKRLQKEMLSVETQAQHLESLETELQEYANTLESLEAEYQEAQRTAAASQNSTGGDNNSNDDDGDNAAAPVWTTAQEEEYERVKEAAAAASATFKRKLASLNSQLSAARAAAADRQAELDQAVTVHKTATSKVQQFQERRTKLTAVRVFFKFAQLCIVTITACVSLTP